MANGQAQLFFLLCLLTTGKHIISPSQLPGGVWSRIPFCYLFNYPFSQALFLGCSQPDLLWNAAKSSLHISRPPAAAPRNSLTPRIFQPLKNLCLWNNGSPVTLNLTEHLCVIGFSLLIFFKNCF